MHFFHAGVGGPASLEEVELALDRLERLDYAREDEVSVPAAIADIQTVLAFFTLVRFDSRAPEIHRIVTNRRVRSQEENCRLHRVAELKYPPGERCGFGRANWVHDSTFYGSFSEIGCVAEVEPVMGELVTHSVWKSVATVDTLNVVPICDSDATLTAHPYLRSYGEAIEAYLASLDARRAGTMRRTSRFVTARFTAPMKSDNPFEYLVSAVVAKHLIALPGPVDAIIYPNVSLGLQELNIAMRPASFDRVYYLDAATELFIRTVPDKPKSGWYGTRTACVTRPHDEKEEIFWDDVRVREEDIAELSS